MFLKRVINVSKAWESQFDSPLLPVVRASVPLIRENPEDCLLTDYGMLTFIIEVENGRYKGVHADYFYHPLNTLGKSNTTDLLLPGFSTGQMATGRAKSQFPSLLRKIYFDGTNGTFKIRRDMTFNKLEDYLLNKVDYISYFSEDVQSVLHLSSTQIVEEIKNYILRTYGVNDSVQPVPYIITIRVDGKLPGQIERNVKTLEEKVFGVYSPHEFPKEIVCEACGKHPAMYVKKGNPYFGRWTFITANDRSYISYGHRRIINLCPECRSHAIQASDIVERLFTFGQFFVIPQFSDVQLSDGQSASTFFRLYNTFLRNSYTLNDTQKFRLEMLFDFIHHHGLHMAVFHKYKFERNKLEMKICKVDDGIIGETVLRHMEAKAMLEDVFNHLNIQFNYRHWRDALVVNGDDKRYEQWLGFISSDHPYWIDDKEILSIIRDIRIYSEGEWWKKLYITLRKLFIMQLYQRVYQFYIHKGGQVKMKLQVPPALPTEATPEDLNRYAQDVMDYIENMLSLDQTDRADHPSPVSDAKAVAEAEARKAYILLGMKARQAIIAERNKNSSNTQRALKRFRMTETDVDNLIAVVEDALMYSQHSTLRKSILDRLWATKVRYMRQVRLSDTAINGCIATGMALYDVVFPFQVKTVDESTPIGLDSTV